MKRVLISAAVLATLAGGSSAAFALGPGPNGHNEHGLCTAYFAGSQTGQDHKHQAGPFAALEQAADDGDDSTPPAEDVAMYCADYLTGNGNQNGNNGNPDAGRSPKG